VGLGGVAGPWVFGDVSRPRFWDKAAAPGARPETAIKRLSTRIAPAEKFVVFAKGNIALAEKFVAVAKRNVALAEKFVAVAERNVALAVYDSGGLPASCAGGADTRRLIGRPLLAQASCRPCF
jgi:hypothetical protein